MLYTVGRISVYDKYLDEDANAAKGITGSVWQTHKEASDYTSEGFGVYGVIADWETDAIPVQGENFRELVVEAKLVRVGFAGERLADFRIRNDTQDYTTFWSGRHLYLYCKSKPLFIGFVMVYNADRRAVYVDEKYYKFYKSTITGFLRSWNVYEPSILFKDKTFFQTIKLSIP